MFWLYFLGTDILEYALASLPQNFVISCKQWKWDIQIYMLIISAVLTILQGWLEYEKCLNMPYYEDHFFMLMFAWIAGAFFVCAKNKG